jgi:hypothetical protein
MGIVILDIIVMRLIKYTVWIVVAVGVFVSDTPRLAQWRIWIYATYALYSGYWILLGVVLTSNQQYPLMKSTNNRYFWRLGTFVCCFLLFILRRLRFYFSRFLRSRTRDIMWAWALLKWFSISSFRFTNILSFLMLYNLWCVWWWLRLWDYYFVGLA